jgi:hypothetical protein
VGRRVVTGVAPGPAILAEVREAAQSVLHRHEAWAIGQQLLSSVGAGWLEAPGSDVVVSRSAPWH